MFPSLPVFLSADISFMAYVERGTGACFHTIWQPANLRQFVNFIRKVYVLMVTGAGKISKKVAVGWGFLYYTTLRCDTIRSDVLCVQLVFFYYYYFRYDHIKPGGRGGGPPMDHSNRTGSAGASVLPSTGPGPPPSATRITKKPIVLRDRGRPSHCTCFGVFSHHHSSLWYLVKLVSEFLSRFVYVIILEIFF